MEYLIRIPVWASDNIRVVGVTLQRFEVEDILRVFTRHFALHVRLHAPAGVDGTGRFGRPFKRSRTRGAFQESGGAKIES